MNSNQSSVISKKENAMYTYHYDHQNEQWNIFEVLRGYEIYICSVKTVDEAIAYCNANAYPSGGGSLFSSTARGGTC